jgi:hypothetical protein
MNNQQFVYWFNGFVDAVGEKGPTPKQWETIVSELGKVGEPIVYPPSPNTAPNTIPFVQPYHQPSKYPHENFRTYCGDTILTATTGSGTVYGAFGGVTTNGNTTWTNMPKDTNVSYTANLPEDL